jgi:NAD(P)-dependent dehydrogenase (short-subunit alcohol dehydrogenase family)
MGDKLKNKVAIVTGSGRAIGEALAIALANEGARVVTNDVVPGSAEATAKKIKVMGKEAASFPCDITDFKATERLVKTAADTFGRLDILVNNAGTQHHDMIWDFSEKDFDRIVDVSLKGAFNCSHHATAIMKEQKWGRVINASSGAALGMIASVAYGAAKAGIVGLTRDIALDVATFGGTCNAYCPRAQGLLIPWDQKVAQWKMELAAGHINQATYDSYMSLPMPDTVAPLIVYLCTEEAGQINGQLFNIIGGKISIYSMPQIKETINKAEGLWTVEELIKEVPRTLLKGYKPIGS